VAINPKETAMNRSMALPVSAYSATELALWSWLVFGAVVIALIPQARGMQSMIGWLPFWFIVAPLLDLGFVHRERLRSTARAVFNRQETIRARRRRRTAQQAKPIRHRRTTKASPSRASVFEV
jgi:hypothetical protein